MVKFVFNNYGENIVFTIDEIPNIYKLCDSFERFLLASGYGSNLVNSVINKHEIQEGLYRLYDLRK